MAQTQPAAPKPGPRRPDALRCPREYPVDPKYGRDVARNRVFGPVFGCKRVWSTELVDRAGESLIRPNRDGTVPAGTSFYFPKGHPYAGRDRYEWFVADRDGRPVAPETGDPGEEGRLKVGYLVADPYEADEQTREEVAAAYEKTLAEHRASPEFLARMKDLGIEPGDAGKVAPPQAPDRGASQPRPELGKTMAETEK